MKLIARLDRPTTALVCRVAPQPHASVPHLPSADKRYESGPPPCILTPAGDTPAPQARPAFAGRAAGAVIQRPCRPPGAQTLPPAAYLGGAHRAPRLASSELTERARTRHQLRRHGQPSCVRNFFPSCTYRRRHQSSQRPRLTHAVAAAGPSPHRHLTPARCHFPSRAAIRRPRSSCAVTDPQRLHAAGTSRPHCGNNRVPAPPPCRRAAQLRLPAARSHECASSCAAVSRLRPRARKSHKSSCRRLQLPAQSPRRSPDPAAPRGTDPAASGTPTGA